jgi:diguanylate cyclase (GGDEF)-like protein/PAS domain S-box-containing protein
VLDRSLPCDAGAAELRAEIDRLKKIARVLMDRAERSTIVQGSDFGLFQSAVVLEEQVRRRTADLEAALRENDRITRDLRESEARFHGLVSQSLVGIATIENGRFGYTNAKFDDIFGYERGEMRQLGPVDIAIEPDKAGVAETLRQRVAGEVDAVHYLCRARRKDGRIVDIENHGSAMDLGGKRLLITLVQDISDRIQAQREVNTLQEQLRDQAVRDSLTGLHNRRYLDEALERELLRAEREGYCVSVVIGDLDRFKAVNDLHGHLAGDEVLRAFADLTLRHVRATDICCRYGGEEFLLVLPGMSGAHAAERAEQLRREAAASPTAWNGSPITMTASFGVGTFPQHGATPDELIAAADEALYAAKAAGRNRVMLPGVPRPGARGCPTIR